MKYYSFTAEKASVLEAFMIFVIFVLAYFLHAWVLLKLWGWFIKPSFDIDVSYKAWLGICLLVRVVDSNYSNKETISAQELILFYGRALLILATGYAIQLFL